MTETYHVWCPDYGHKGPEDGAPIHGAYDAREAAETWAARYDRYSAAYSIVGGSEAVVCVKAPDGSVTRWTVYDESVPSYRATEVK
jgi:hypothetical protein